MDEEDVLLGFAGVSKLSGKKNNTYDKSRTLGISKSNIDYFNSQIINIEKILWKSELCSKKIRHSTYPKVFHAEKKLSKAEQIT